MLSNGFERSSTTWSSYHRVTLAPKQDLEHLPKARLVLDDEEFDRWGD